MTQKRDLAELIRGEIRRPATVITTEAPTLKPQSGHRLSLKVIDLPAWQPRRYFDQEKLEELAADIKKRGVQSAVWVRPKAGGRYELVAGERRYRASELAGLTEIPADIKDLSDAEALEYALIENLAREDLNPVEEAYGYLRLLSQHLDRPVDEVKVLLYSMHNHVQRNPDKNVFIIPDAQEVIAVFESLGRRSWQSYVTTLLGLLKKPVEVLNAIEEGKIAYTKGLAIARVKDEALRRKVLGVAIEQNLSLTQIKELIAQKSSTAKPAESVNLSVQFVETLRKGSKSLAWSDPEKQKRLKELLVELNHLLVVESKRKKR
ncbi:ParB/RepB/Spo0J family partition protein [Leptolyngbya sp. FACHB-261]|uniref:ParB/RepB/Spo0J family partition protein n=1 Tax=Leptolyngbya sp. FACHB-261 TaxID=2692806 RepID=UPI001685A9E0|nr:ParB/RepB/Spo0J family partition protein [Leptolyngbya sp. FACHB-261]MBD2105169.1 ParB/RepB/Spo0J family partition protein [Leptolyngbya sp. FACHB-261]